MIVGPACELAARAGAPGCASALFLIDLECAGLSDKIAEFSEAIATDIEIREQFRYLLSHKAEKRPSILAFDL
jgi:hypothetical protein